jgi:hypothetical protein
VPLVPLPDVLLPEVLPVEFMLPDAELLLGVVLLVLPLALTEPLAEPLVVLVSVLLDVVLRSSALLLRVLRLQPAVPRPSARAANVATMDALICFVFI